MNKVAAHFYTKSYASPLGAMILCASDDAVCGVWFDGQAHQLDASAWTESQNHALLGETEVQLGDYFSGKRTQFDLPIAFLWGSPFQHSVWHALRSIRYGQHLTYGALAAALNRPKAVRAVGAAIGHNPISVVVPCHRVIGAQGALTGYAGGIERKKALLQQEGIL